MCQDGPVDESYTSNKIKSKKDSSMQSASTQPSQGNLTASQKPKKTIVLNYGDIVAMDGNVDDKDAEMQFDRSQSNISNLNHQGTMSPKSARDRKSSGTFGQ